MSTMSQVPETVKHTLDWAAVGAAAATVAGWLPPLAALMSIVWLGLQMYDRYRRIQKEKRDAARAEDHAD